VGARDGAQGEHPVVQAIGQPGDLVSAPTTRVNRRLGVVSMSWGAAEFGGETYLDPT